MQANVDLAVGARHGGRLENVWSFPDSLSSTRDATYGTVQVLFPMPTRREMLRFLDFELDVSGYQLRHKGRAVRIERQPMDLLILLVQRRPQLVSREEIIERLWGKDVFVDVETGVHTAIRKIRLALRDSPEAPTCVETVTGRGLSIHRAGRDSRRGAARAASDGLTRAGPA